MLDFTNAQHSTHFFCHHHGQADGGHQEERPWDMLFADDIVLPGQNHRELEEDLEM